MKASTASIPSTTVRSGLAVVLAIGALVALNSRAHADELDPITISAPTETTVGYDDPIRAPIEQTTVQARIAADAETLTMDSGVKLLRDRVQEAAFKACSAADPFSAGDSECIDRAVKAAKPRVDAAIAHVNVSLET